MHFLLLQAKTTDEFGEETRMSTARLPKFESDSKTYLSVTAERYEIEVKKVFYSVGSVQRCCCYLFTF